MLFTSKLVRKYLSRKIYLYAGRAQSVIFQFSKRKELEIDAPYFDVCSKQIYEASSIHINHGG